MIIDQHPFPENIEADMLSKYIRIHSVVKALVLKLIKKTYFIIESAQTRLSTKIRHNIDFQQYANFLYNRRIELFLSLILMSDSILEINKVYEIAVFIVLSNLNFLYP